MNTDRDKGIKNKVRFNILDAIIILMAVLCVVGVAFRYSIMQKLGFSKELSDFRIMFKLSAVSYTIPGFLHDGDKLYYSDGAEAGELLGVTEYSSYTELTAENETLILMPATKYVNDRDGNPVLAAYPEFTYIDVTGAFLCQGAYTSDGYFGLGGDKYLAVGQKLTLYTDMVTLNLTITSIEKLQP